MVDIRLIYCYNIFRYILRAKHLIYYKHAYYTLLDAMLTTLSLYRRAVTKQHLKSVNFFTNIAESLFLSSIFSVGARDTHNIYLQSASFTQVFLNRR